MGGLYSIDQCCYGLRITVHIIHTLSRAVSMSRQVDSNRVGAIIQSGELVFPKQPIIA